MRATRAIDLVKEMSQTSGRSVTARKEWTLERRMVSARCLPTPLSLKSYYGRKKSRGMGKPSLLARKFPGVVYRTLENNWVFEDFPRSVLAGGSDSLNLKDPPPCLRSAQQGFTPAPAA